MTCNTFKTLARAIAGITAVMLVAVPGFAAAAEAGARAEARTSAEASYSGNNGSASASASKHSVIGLSHE